ncbi:MAG: hypothetical protein ACOCXM_11495 [Myxococcota bacterium]
MLLDAVRTAFADEATDIVADVELDLPEAKPIRSAAGPGGGPARATEEALWTAPL